MILAPVYLALDIDSALDTLTTDGLRSFTGAVDIRPALFYKICCG